VTVAARHAGLEAERVAVTDLRSGQVHVGPLDAATPGNGYGDDSSVMGSRRDWKGYNAPNRYMAGWLASLHVMRVTDSRQYLLRPLHVPPQIDGPRSALIFDCQKCNAEEPKTQVWVSYREATGYDMDLPPLYKDKVSVHWLRLNNGGANAGTIVQKTLGVGEAYQVPQTGHVIRVCALRPSSQPGRAGIAAPDSARYPIPGLCRCV